MLLIPFNLLRVDKDPAPPISNRTAPELLEDDRLPLLLLPAGGRSSLGHSLRGAGLPAGSIWCLLLALCVTGAIFSADCKTNDDLEDMMVVCNFISKGDDMNSVNGDPSGRLRLAGGVSCRSKKDGLAEV